MVDKELVIVYLAVICYFYPLWY